MARLCAHQLTALLTAVLTDELAGRSGGVCALRQLTALLTATLTATLTGGEILRGFLSPGLPDNPIMSRDDSIEPLYSQGCDQGL